jgi:hypothetical protein
MIARIMRTIILSMKRIIGTITKPSQLRKNADKIDNIPKMKADIPPIANIIIHVGTPIQRLYVTLITQNRINPKGHNENNDRIIKIDRILAITKFCIDKATTRHIFIKQPKSINGKEKGNDIMPANTVKEK